MTKAYSSPTLGLVLATSALAFAPAPVFREPPKPKVPDIFAAIQGTWDYRGINTNNINANKGRRQSIRVRIRDNTWQYVYIMNGVEREGVKYEIVLDAKQNPPTLDLKSVARANRPAPPGGRVGPFALKGIVKVEGDSLTLCYVRCHDQNTARPKQFGENELMQGEGGVTMTLQRVE